MVLHLIRLDFKLKLCKDLHTQEAVTRNVFKNMRPTHSIISDVIAEAIGVNVIGAANTKPKSIGRSWPFLLSSMSVNLVE